MKSNFLAEMDQPQNMSIDPPFHKRYKTLIDKAIVEGSKKPETKSTTTNHEVCELPLIDLQGLGLKDELEREKCKDEIAKASREWGFFQVVNHGISTEILEKMRKEQIKVFKRPFEQKSKEDKFMNLSCGTYRWGTPTATCLAQFSWSEAFHIHMSDINSAASNGSPTFSTSTMEQFATTSADLAQKLAKILAEKIGRKSSFFEEHCLPSTCYLRLNRYPACPYPANMVGLTAHTDSDFLTILHQDQVGGLQLLKDGKWFAVKPNPHALIVNIGDLFQAWSNDVYKSVEHRVVCNQQVERFSTAYFWCPSYDTEIESDDFGPSVYKKFSFRDYREQVQRDVRLLGRKIGLSRFLAQPYIICQDSW